MNPGEELAGRYRLEVRLGRGGMGEVWRALDQDLVRRVAVKLLLIDWSGRHNDQVTRFRIEARAAARLDHPRIAVLHDIAVDQDRPFLVLALLPGPDLATKMTDHPGGLPIQTALGHGAQAAEGLAAAHAAGVIHRDIKPSNLMLDGTGELRICDFGIAHLEGGTAGPTAPGAILGTLAYMPPEQLRGEKIKSSADVYALGATLFHLLTGRPPFTGTSQAIVAQHLAAPPPRAGSFRFGIPAGLDLYLSRLLAKDPAERPQSAVEVARELRAIASDYQQRMIIEERIRRLVAKIEQLIPTLGYDENGDNARHRIARLLADIDPDEAERIARAIHDGEAGMRASALAKVAEAVASHNPARARTLLSEAGHTARTFRRHGAGHQSWIFADIAASAATWDPDHARFLLAQAEGFGPAAARAAIAEAFTALKDLAEAERIARTITDTEPTATPKAAALAMIAKAAAERQPTQAHALLTEAINLTRNDRELHQVAEIWAHQDPAAAEHIAHTMRDPWRSWTLVTTAGVWAERGDIPEAERLARVVPETSTRRYDSVGPLPNKALVLAHIAKALAKHDQPRARSLISEADRLTHRRYEDDGSLTFRFDEDDEPEDPLTPIISPPTPLIEALALLDWNEAERRALAIPEPQGQVYRLYEIANTLKHEGIAGDF